MIIVSPNSSSRPEMNNPEITSTRVLTGTSRKTRAKAFSQTEGFRHLFGSTRTQRFSMLSRLPSKLLERGICFARPAARAAGSAGSTRGGPPRAERSVQARRFCAGATGSCRRDVPYAGRHRGSFGPKHSGWRQAPFPVCGIMGPGPIPLRSTPGSFPQGRDRDMTVVKSLRPVGHSRARDAALPDGAAALEPSHDTQRSVKGVSATPRVVLVRGPVGRAEPQPGTTAGVMH